eukprot:COSAG02_NODE_11770_length_1657_cov_1.869063_4_plen_112_part_01
MTMADLHGKMRLPLHFDGLDLLGPRIAVALIEIQDTGQAPVVGLAKAAVVVAGSKGGVGAVEEVEDTPPFAVAAATAAATAAAAQSIAAAAAAAAVAADNVAAVSPAAESVA